MRTRACDGISASWKTRAEVIFAPAGAASVRNLSPLLADDPTIRTPVPPDEQSRVTVNGAPATLNADNRFYKSGVTLVNGDNISTAVATDSAGRKDTNSITVKLSAPVSYQYDLNGNLRADANRMLNKHIVAISDYTKVIESDNPEPEAFYYRGICYYSVGNMAKAGDDFREALKLDPGNPKYIASLNQLK